MEPRIIYEDDEILAVNKPAGLLVHHTRRCQVSGIKCQEPTITDWLLQNRPAVKSVGDDPMTRPGIVHRLDRETSGVMLIAKTQEAFLRLKALFAGRGMTKTYLALVRGAVRKERGTIERPIGIVSGSVRRSVYSRKMAKDAVTEYRVEHGVTLPDGTVGTLVAVHPRTGRTHQIRVHLASIGHPIVGDQLYDKRSRSGRVDGRMFLHALSIAWDPVPGKHILIEAEPPPEFVPYLSTRLKG
jgi:23S rRNA pseudouridine1911/1915/1917 synthase